MRVEWHHVFRQETADDTASFAIISSGDVFKPTAA
jgi:hypothetical protein